MARSENTELITPEFKYVGINALKPIISHVVIEENEVLMIEGASGIGKTRVVEQWCEENDAFLVTFMISQYDSVDFRGTPWTSALDAIGESFPDHKPHTDEELEEMVGDDLLPDEEDEIIIGLGPTGKTKTQALKPDHSQSFGREKSSKKFTVWHPASTLPFKGNPRFPTDKKIVLFFDEATSGKLDVLAILYQLTDKRCVGEHELMDNVYIILAGNRAEDKGIVNRFPLPLCNRLTWVGALADLPGWGEYMTVKYGSVVAPYVAYFRWQKEEFHNYDPAKPKRVFCSPRTAEKAAKYFLSATMPMDVKLVAMSGVVGGDVCDKFWGFLTIWQGVTELMKDIVKNPKTADIPHEPSVQWAIALSISGNMTFKNASNYYEYLKRMDGEYCIASWQMAVSREQKAKKEGRMPKTAPNLYESDPFIDMAIRYKAIFTRK